MTHHKLGLDSSALANRVGFPRHTNHLRRERLCSRERERQRTILRSFHFHIKIATCNEELCPYTMGTCTASSVSVFFDHSFNSPSYPIKITGYIANAKRREGGEVRGGGRGAYKG